jgi:hypothetical protein
MLFSLLGFLACVGDVRPGPNGQNSIIIITEDKAIGSRQMLRQAKRYCKKQDGNLIVHEENALFVCEIEEHDYIRRKNLAKAAQYIGSTDIDSDFKEEGEDSIEDTIREVVGTAGAVTDIALGDCYEQEIIFECEN